MQEQPTVSKDEPRMNTNHQSVCWCSFVSIRGSPFAFADFFLVPWSTSPSIGFRQGWSEANRIRGQLTLVLEVGGFWLVVGGFKTFNGSSFTMKPSR